MRWRWCAYLVKHEQRHGGVLGVPLHGVAHQDELVVVQVAYDQSRAGRAERAGTRVTVSRQGQARAKERLAEPVGVGAGRADSAVAISASGGRRHMGGQGPAEDSVRSRRRTSVWRAHRRGPRRTS